MYIIVVVVVILFLLLVIYLNSQTKLNRKVILYKNYIKPFISPYQITELLEKDSRIKISEYNLDSLYSSKEIDSTWDNFFDKNFEINPDRNYQVKTITKKSFVNLNDSNIAYKKLRASMTPWSFPKHFDTVDQLLIVMYGNRDILVEDKLYKLNAGDALFIPMGNNHTVTTNKDFPFSILLTIGFKPDKTSDTFNYYLKLFKEKWSKQVGINNSGWY